MKSFVSSLLTLGTTITSSSSLAETPPQSPATIPELPATPYAGHAETTPTPMETPITAAGSSANPIEISSHAVEPNSASRERKRKDLPATPAGTPAKRDLSNSYVEYENWLLRAALLHEQQLRGAVGGVPIGEGGVGASPAAVPEDGGFVSGVDAPGSGGAGLRVLQSGVAKLYCYGLDVLLTQLYGKLPEKPVLGEMVFMVEKTSNAPSKSPAMPTDFTFSESTGAALGKVTHSPECQTMKTAMREGKTVVGKLVGEMIETPYGRFGGDGKQISWKIKGTVRWEVRG